MKDKVLNKARNHIAKGDLAAALAELSQPSADKAADELILISHNFNSFSKRKNKGLLSFDQLILQENRIANSLLELINDLDKKELEGYLENFKPPNDVLTVLEDLLAVLEVTYDMFKAQANIRDLLRGNIVKRLKITNSLQHEVFFSTYYDQMNEEELRLHQTIRGYTENVLSKYNQQALDLIQANKDLRSVLPRLKLLERHLVIWLGKFNSVFQFTPSMSLVYVGVEEGVPFPSGIEREIKRYAEQKRQMD